MKAQKTYGQCFCGSIRFHVLGPEKFACLCYCESCQRASGAPSVGWATYAHDSFVVTHGKLREYRSSPGVTRGHCPHCGTSVTYENAQRPGEIDVTLNSLDDPARPAPRAHIWTEDKQPWLEIGDDLPVFRRTVND